MSKRKIVIYSTRVFIVTQHKHIFTDWFEFADWVKQENLAGRSVTIAHWEYI